MGRDDAVVGCAIRISKSCAVIARSAATKQSILSLRGAMDCFASLAMTVSNMLSRPRGAMRPSCAKIFRPIEGAGNAGCLLHPRSRVQYVQRTRTRAYRYSRSIPASLRNGFTAYAALSPATNSSCHRHRRIEGFAAPGWAGQNLRRLDTSNGCQDHTVLPYASAPFRLSRLLSAHRPEACPANPAAPDAAASTASHPNVRDDGRRPSSGMRRRELCP
jgi:hypothetical protein